MISNEGFQSTIAAAPLTRSPLPPHSISSLMPRATQFTFSSYRIDASRSTVFFTYRITFESGRVRTYTDRLRFHDVPSDAWSTVPPEILEPTLQALLFILGINYWCVFRTPHITIDGFKLTPEQAQFWNDVYLHGLGEFFYVMQINFDDLIAFPFDASRRAPQPSNFSAPNRALLLHGAGKDSLLSAEMLKENRTPFDFFAFAPTPAHTRTAALVGARLRTVSRRRDPRLNFFMEHFGISTAYPSVTTFSFVAVLLAELVGYNRIIFSNERSADFGNVTYRGLPVNHQWCKSSIAERMINEYISQYITPAITTSSLLRTFSELEIVRRFVQYPEYRTCVTSCNTYFWLPRPLQYLSRRSYWCTQCPKCVFLFACFAAFLPKKAVVEMFRTNLFARESLLPTFKSILGVEGHKPLDCVGEPEEMILAMHYAARRDTYSNDIAMKFFIAHFGSPQSLENLEKKVLSQK